MMRAQRGADAFVIDASVNYESDEQLLTDIHTGAAG